MIARAGEVAAQPGHWWCDQLNNHDAIAGYLPLAEEIWTQTGGRVDAFVHVVGTSHSIHGVAMALRVHKPALHVVAVEPAESAVLSAGCAHSDVGGMDSNLGWLWLAVRVCVDSLSCRLV